MLWVFPIPPSPPRFGAQARMHGLATALAPRHDVTAVALLDEGQDPEEARAAMGGWAREAILVPNPAGRDGAAKRLLQLRSLAAPRSYERLRFAPRALGRVLDRRLRREPFDAVVSEFPYLGPLALRRAPRGAAPPAVVVDSHEIAWDLARQIARGGKTPLRRLYGEVNWRKLRREELAAYRGADGVCACSEADRRRILEDAPRARVRVVPNAADVERLRPRPTDPAPDGRTVLFFGLLSTVPNVDGIRWFVQEIWPRVLAVRPDARCRVIGARPAPEVHALAGNGVEIVGFVEDLRPHLAAAAAVVVPLRVGGGTRLKIVEAMAMAKPVVSTRLGAEGIEAEPGRDLLLADEPDAFAQAVVRVLGDAALRERMGAAARALARERYAWTAAGHALEGLVQECLAAREAGGSGT
jgi:glycosyltransferase involved in cell wall biosynthesis